MAASKFHMMEDNSRQATKTKPMYRKLLVCFMSIINFWLKVMISNNVDTELKVNEKAITFLKIWEEVPAAIIDSSNGQWDQWHRKCQFL